MKFYIIAGNSITKEFHFSVINANAIKDAETEAEALKDLVSCGNYDATIGACYNSSVCEIRDVINDFMDELGI